MDKPTNQFSVKVDIPFPTDDQQVNLLRWFNLQNLGKETIPSNKKISDKYSNYSFNLHQSRRYEFVFEITKDGEWVFVGRKA